MNSSWEYSDSLCLNPWSDAVPTLNQGYRNTVGLHYCTHSRNNGVLNLSELEREG